MVDSDDDGTDMRTPLVSIEYDPASETPSRALFSALDRVLDGTLDETKPSLYTCIDVDALDSLFPNVPGDTAGANNLFHFTYRDYSVYVYSNGRIQICQAN